MGLVLQQSVIARSFIATFNFFAPYINQFCSEHYDVVVPVICNILCAQSNVFLRMYDELVIRERLIYSLRVIVQTLGFPHSIKRIITRLLTQSSGSSKISLRDLRAARTTSSETSNLASLLVASSYEGVRLVLQVVGTILVTLNGVAATIGYANWNSKAQKGKRSVGIM